jgi:hypothetical protein
MQTKRFIIGFAIAFSLVSTVGIPGITHASTASPAYTPCTQVSWKPYAAPTNQPSGSSYTMSITLLSSYDARDGSACGGLMGRGTFYQASGGSGTFVVTVSDSSNGGVASASAPYSAGNPQIQVTTGSLNGSCGSASGHYGNTYVGTPQYCV